MATPTPSENPGPAWQHPLRQLAQQLDMAQAALDEAARLCPGDAALQAGLMERAAWCRAQLCKTRDRLSHGLVRRADDRRG